MFYEKEVFLSSLEETMPAEYIAGKCCVLPFREYVRCEEMLHLLKLNFSLRDFGVQKYKLSIKFIPVSLCSLKITCRGIT